MMLHDRRSFARRLAALAGAAALPDLLAAFVGQDPQPAQVPKQPPPPPRRDLVAAAIARARAESKPLLVFVVPADAERCWQRGSRLGALVNHGGLFVRDLALTVPVCASIADLRELLPKVEFAGDPLMFALDPDQEAPARAIDAEYRQPALRGFDDVEVDKAIRADIAALTAATAAALRPDDQALARLAQRARSRCDDATVAHVDAWLAGGELPSHAEVVRLAAHVLVAAGSMPAGRRDAVLAGLDDSIRAHVVLQRVPGAKWASSMGCGETVESLPGEPDESEQVMCGMGNVPPLSRRFLKFLTEK